MSHECPECGETCFCNGDIGDCELHGTEEQMNCTHREKCEWRDQEDDFIWDDYDD
jgi:hypothetical protein